MKERTRTIILLVLFAVAAGFIWYLRSEVGTNFEDTIEDQPTTETSTSQ